ncbi:hypothetical protein ACDW_40930 [Acidovorax sp. DW039]|uniref:hypothetical protein n=1 Tax=Acidovorax sp. DW039 TaxID=3095606 RepID=UPI00308BBEA7|nr:hypothetical protein ACDW_40930 [Acidovorax sp. DW039]
MESTPPHREQTASCGFARAVHRPSQPLQEHGQDMQRAAPCMLPLADFADIRLPALTC